MRFKSLFFAVFFAALALCCTPGSVVEEPQPGGGDGTEEPSNPSDPSDPSDPSEPDDPNEPSEPSLPAYIEFASNYLFADYNGGADSFVVDVDPSFEWEIACSESWFTAQRSGNKLVVTFSPADNRLERKGTLTVKVGSGENVAEDSVVVWQIGTDTEELIYEVETTVPGQRVVAAPILTYLWV